MKSAIDTDRPIVTAEEAMSMSVQAAVCALVFAAMVGWFVWENWAVIAVAFNWSNV